MSSRTIRADTTLKLQAPRYEVVTSNYYLTNIPPLNNANLQVLSRNPITGEVQLTEKNSADFGTTVLNASIVGTSLITNPGTSNSHSLKTLRSTNSSINIIPSASEIDLQAQISLLNATPLGDAQVLQTAGTGSNFIFKSINAGSKINLLSDPNSITISTPGTIELQNRGIGSQIIHDPGIDDNFSLKSLVAGTNITLSSNDDEITINNSLTGFITQSNLGAGEPILSDPGTDEHFDFKTLIAGSGIALSSNAQTVTISASGGSGNITQTNLGVGTPILTDPGTDSIFAFRTVQAGTNITLSSDPNTLIIGTTLTGNINQSNLGAGISILSNPGTSNTFSYKTLVAGSNVTIGSDANTITLGTTPTPITQNNRGTGLGILSDPGVDADFSFKTLKAGPTITLTPTADDITIDTTLTGNITQANLGVGEPILSDPGTDNSFSFKSLVAGSNIALSSNANQVTISTPLTGNITQTKLGSDEGLLGAFGTANSFGVKSLVAGSGIALSSTANEISISNIGSLVNVDLENIGTGVGLISNPGVNNLFNFRSILAGTGIQIVPSLSGDEYIISNDGSAVNVMLDNTTLSGEALLVDPGLNSSFHFKTLLAGTGVSLASDANSITINSTGISSITQSNLGLGEPILSDPGMDSSFSFKTLVSNSSHITIGSDANTVTLDTDLTGQITQSNLGAGETILSDPGTDSSFGFKTLVAGSNINLISSPTTVTISTPSDGNITQSNLGLGQAILGNPGTSNTFNYKTLIAGTNMALASDANTVTINNSLTGNITQSNLGAGEGVLSDPGSDDTFAFKSLVAGTHMTLGSDANQITIGTTLTGNITLHAVGTGDNFLSDAGTDNDFSFKSIVGGSGIGILPAGNDIVISATQQNITQSNLGVGANILATPGTLSSFDFKTLIQGTGIFISNGSNSITISSSITQSNIGIGTNLILKNPGTGINFDFKSIIAGAGILITNGINDLTFASNISANNVGAGSGIVASTSTGSSLDFKSLIAGTGITLSAAATAITISATPSTGVTINNVGIGAGRVMKTTGLSTTFDVKSILAGTNITTVNGTDEITLNVPNTNLDNVGTGSGLLINTGSLGVSSARNFKTLLAGTGITLSAGVNEITINASTQNSDMANLGAGSAILATTGTLPTTTVRNFRTLVAGSNVTLSSTADEITINSTGGGITPTSYGFSTEITSGTLTSIAVNPSYTTIASYTTPAYGFNSGLLNTGTGVFTIGAGDVGTYTVSFYIQASNTNATASSKNYIDLVFRNTTTNINYINLTQDMPSNGKYTIGFTKPFSLTTGTYEMRLSKQRTGGTFTVGTTLNSAYSIYRIA